MEVKRIFAYPFEEASSYPISYKSILDKQNEIRWHMKGMSDPLELMPYDEFCDCYGWIQDKLEDLNNKRKRNAR